MITLADAAREYLRRGYRITPAKGKDAFLKDWPNLDLTDSDIAKYWGRLGNNISIVIRDMNDIDLDCQEAVALAPRFLPPTDMIHGRKGKPRSHWWYRPDVPVKSFKYKDIDGSTLLEVRGPGLQTVVPPSVHPGGEDMIWYGTGEPAAIDGRILADLCARLAGATLIARHWVAGGRHDLSLSLAGALLRNGWDVDSAGEFITVIGHAAGDDDAPDRLRAIRDTDAALRRGEHVTGIPTVAAILGQPVTDRLCEWLNLSRRDEERWEFDLPTNPDKIERPYLVNLIDFNHYVFPPVRWLVEGVLREIQVNITGGPPKSYKSYLELYMHLCIALGRPMFDLFNVGPARPTLYVQLEQGGGNLQKRLHELQRGMGVDFRDPLLRNFNLVTNQPVRLDDEESVTKLVDEGIKKCPDIPAIVTVDTLRRAHRKKENDSDEMSVVMAVLIHLRDQWETSMSVLHHLGKNPETTDPGNALRGSGDIWAACDNGIFIAKHYEIVNDVRIKRALVMFDGREHDWADPFYFHPLTTGPPDAQTTVLTFEWERAEHGGINKLDLYYNALKSLGEGWHPTARIADKAKRSEHSIRDNLSVLETKKLVKRKAVRAGGVVKWALQEEDDDHYSILG